MSIYRSNFSKIIFYQFQTNILQRQINEIMGATINQITNRDLDGFKILLPSESGEQAKITNALSDINALIQSLEKLIIKKIAIKQGAMQELLKPKNGWVIRKLEEVSSSIASGKSSTKSNNGKYPIYGSTGIIGWNKEHDYHGTKILVARVGANAGIVNLVHGKYNVSDNTLMISLENGIDTNFVYFQLIHFNLNILVFGSGQPLITGGQLKSLNIAIPIDESEQALIASILSGMDTEIASLETKLAKYKLIKQGMMQNLLTGRIRLI